MLAALISFSRDVMPILALCCANCHGLPSQNPAANLSLRSYSSLMRGGNIGSVVVPGNADESPLMQFIDGRRGAGQRMPMNAPPLKAAQIELIRSWIDQGAKADEDTASKFVFDRAISARAGDLIHIAAHVPKGCFVTVEALGNSSRRQLWVAEQTASPPLEWNIRTGTDWPRKIKVAMTVRYCMNSGESRFTVRNSGPGKSTAMLKYSFPGGCSWQ